jgi:dTDP-4-dehydrorhamnose reductase
MRTLIFGDSSGLLCSRLRDALNADLSQAHLQDPKALVKELDNKSPSLIINCREASLKQCEDNKNTAYRVNVVGAINLAMLCERYNLQYAHISSGDIYEGYKKGHGDLGWREFEPPNFAGNTYARSKAVVEKALEDFGALQVRVRALVDHTQHPDNLLWRLLDASEAATDAENSFTILDDFVKTFSELIESGQKGIFNIVNSGIGTHEIILERYKDIVDNDFEYHLSSLKDVEKRREIKQADCLLSIDKLESFGLSMPAFEESLKLVLEQYKKNYE